MLYVTFTSFKTTIWYFSWFDRFSNCWDNCFRAGRKNRNAVLSILYVFRVACSTLIHSLSLSTSEEPRICTVSFQKWNHRELTKVQPLQTRHLISMWLWVLVLCWPWCWLSMSSSSSLWLWRRQWTLPCAGKVYCTYLRTMLSYLHMPHCITLTQLKRYKIKP